MRCVMCLSDACGSSAFLNDPPTLLEGPPAIPISYLDPTFAAWTRIPLFSEPPLLIHPDAHGEFADAAVVRASRNRHFIAGSFHARSDLGEAVVFPFAYDTTNRGETPWRSVEQLKDVTQLRHALRQAALAMGL